MYFKLEELEYQKIAINSVVKIFDGQIKNTFDNACIEGIRSNILIGLTKEDISKNVKEIIRTTLSIIK